MLRLDGKMPTLIIDPDLAFAESMRNDPASALSPPVVAHSGHEAQALLSRQNTRYAGIFVNPSICHPSGLSVIRCAHVHHVGTPLFLLYDGETAPLPKDELHKLAIQRAVAKPLSYAEMLALVSPILPGFDATAALALSSGIREPTDVELTVEDHEFAPIHIGHFLCGHQTFFDIYVRIRSGRFIKILNAGDEFSEDRIKAYLAKGVGSFFILRQAHASYVSYCDHLATALVSGSKAPASLKVSQSLNAGNETLRFFEDRGLSSAGLAFAGRFVTNIRRLVTELRLEQHSTLTDLLANAAEFEHAVGAAFVTGLLLPRLGISLERLQLAIGLGALLHDIGLNGQAASVEHKAVSDMSETELDIYFAHPQKGARILSEIRGLDSTTTLVVAQHHLRRDGRGFPRRSSAPPSVNLASEIVGVSDEFMRLLQLARNDPSINVAGRMHAEVFDGFSFPVIKAFSDLLSGKD